MSAHRTHLAALAAAGPCAGRGARRPAGAGRRRGSAWPRLR